MMLLLSLKLILLAFFILLNSLADFEAGRARAVLASVNQAFNGKIEGQSMWVDGMMSRKKQVVPSLQDAFGA